jgi:hypothetical protein
MTQAWDTQEFVHDIDEFEGQPFIAMELLEGQTLALRRTSGQRVYRADPDA